MNKLLTLVGALTALAATVNASTELDEAWGGAHLEKWWDAKERLTGAQFTYHGALNTPESRVRIASWSPWDGDGAPPSDYVVGRGTQWKRVNGELSGYNWEQLADGTTTKAPVDTEGLSPMATIRLRYMRGLYEDKDEWGSYRMVGWCFLEVRNRSEQTIDYTLNCEWVQIPAVVSRPSEDQFYVKAGELGGVVPSLPRDWSYGWIAADVLTWRER